MTGYEQFICDEFLKIASNGNSGCSVDKVHRCTRDCIPGEIPTVTIEMSVCPKKEVYESSDPVLFLAEKLCELNNENKALKKDQKLADERIEALIKKNAELKSEKDRYISLLDKTEEKIKKLSDVEKENKDLKYEKKIAERRVDELHAEILRYISCLDEAKRKIKKLSDVEKENESLKKWNGLYKEILINRSDIMSGYEDSEGNPAIYIQIDGVDIHVTSKNNKKGEEENG